MHRLLFTASVCLSCATLRADFSYQETTQMTGGSLVSALRVVGCRSRRGFGQRVAALLSGRERCEAVFAPTPASALSASGFRRELRELETVVVLRRLSGLTADSPTAADRGTGGAAPLLGRPA